MNDAARSEQKRERRAKASSRAALLMFGTQLLIYPLSLSVAILVARILGPADRGIYAFLMLLGSTVLPFFLLGLGQGVRYLLTSGRYPLADVALTSLVVAAIPGVVAGSVLYGLWHVGWLGETAAEIQAIHIVPILALMPLQGVQLICTEIAMGESWFGVVNIYSLVRGILVPLLLGGFVVLGAMRLDGAVAAIVCGELVLTTTIIAVILRRTQLRFRWDGAFVRDCVDYGWKAWLGAMAGRTTVQLDHFLLGLFAAPATLGAYSVAARLAQLLWMPCSAILPVLFNRVAAADDDAERQDLLERIHRLLFWGTTAAGVATGLIAPWLVLFLLGEQYADAVLPLLIMLPGVVIWTSKRVTTKYFGGTGRPDVSSATQGVGSAVAIAAYAVLIPLYGALGGAIASTIAYIVASGAGAWFYRKLTGRPLSALFAARWSDVSWARSRLVAAARRRADKATA